MSLSRKLDFGGLLVMQVACMIYSPMEYFHGSAANALIAAALGFLAMNAREARFDDRETENTA